MPFEVAIIGSAGRREDAAHVNYPTYVKMVKHAEKTIIDLCPHQQVTIVSGGAAFADHVAVSVHLSFIKQGIDTHLHLFLPCRWDHYAYQFDDDGTFNWRTNPGGTANSLHRKFAQALGKDPNKSLKTLHSLHSHDHVTIYEPALNSSSYGFHGRNKKVADVRDLMLAYTFGPGDVPKDGGTSHTWGLCRATKKLHTSIHSL